MAQVNFDTALAEAGEKAWRALARYKFERFGYWAAIWVHLNRLSGQKRRNPWRRLVLEARHKLHQGTPKNHTLHNKTTID